MKQQLLNELKDTTNDLLTTIAMFTEEQFDTVPFEGSWTAGQVAEHIYKSEKNMADIWKGTAVHTQRKADEHVPMIRNVFLDFTTKMKSPDFILPTDKPKQQQRLYDALKKNRKEILETAQATDLEQTFTDFDFPGVGPLTGIEGATFVICHSKRHIHQMEQIYARLNPPA